MDEMLLKSLDEAISQKLRMTSDKSNWTMDEAMLLDYENQFMRDMVTYVIQMNKKLDKILEKLG